MGPTPLRRTAIGGDFTAEQIWLHDQQRELGPDGDDRLEGLFAEHFPRNSLVLDAGGGSGPALRALTRAGLCVLLVDLSAAMLRAGGHRAVPRARADLCALPLPDGSVGGVYAAFVLQNIPRWTRAIEEIVRVLSPTGSAVVAWGQPVTDLVVAAVREHLDEALDQVGATIGVAANAAGLNDLDDGHAAFARNGLGQRAEHRVAGRQTRTIRQLVATRAGNPFMVRASDEHRAEAVQRTLSWAAVHFGGVDTPRSFDVEQLLHTYRS